MQDFIIPLITGLCIFLFISNLVEHYTKKSLLPSSTWILVIGLIYGLLAKYHVFDFPKIEIEPDIVLFLLLPILIFESSQNIRIEKFKSVSGSASFFATVGVIFTMVLIALPFSYLASIPFIDALLFGSIMAATDPVAVNSVFKDFKLPEKLKILIEGESLLNDGTGLILFSLLSSIVFMQSHFSLAQAFGDFFISVFGAVILGFFIGYIGGKIMHYWHEENNEFMLTSMSITIAFSAFFIAEHFLHISGVITILFAALFFTNSQFGCSVLHKHHSKKDEMKHDSAIHFFHTFWEVLGGFANRILFFILGAHIGIHTFDLPWYVVIGIIPILFIARSISVYTGSKILNIKKIRIPLSWQHIINFAGLKGAISIALILLIPKEYIYVELFLCTAFVMIFFTMIGNIVMMQYVLKKTKI